MKIVEMLAYVARLFHEEASEGQLAARTESHDAITPLLSYINDHFTEPLSLDALAAETGYNKFYLCKVFKSTTGITVGSYITKCRIAYAKQLLLSDCSVTDTAFRSGFHDLSHFIRTFRKETGVPPRKYLSDEMSAADSSRYYIGPEL